MKKTIFTSKYIAALGVLVATEIILYVIGANVAFGGININLALVPIAIGAILYGPVCGAILGFVNSIMTFFTPLVQGYFMDTTIFGPWCIFGTILIVLTKTTVAGLISGLLYLLFKNKKTLGAIIASVIVPIINTGLFLIGALIFYRNEFSAIFTVVIFFNFLIELGSTILLSPAVTRIIQIKGIIQNEEN